VTARSKIVLNRGAVRQLDDITDLVALLIPGNRNQQHAAARILLALKAHGAPLAAFAELGRRHGISRRTLERTRAKLAQLGVIERVTWMHRRSSGQEGWVLSSKMTSTLRQLADLWEDWRTDERADRTEKETMLAELLRPATRDSYDPDSR
jgi:DNA-binding HxlR family transcriptional regulator